MSNSIKIGIVEFYDHRSDVEYLVKVLQVEFEIFVIAKKAICDRFEKTSVRTFNLKNLPSNSVSTLLSREQPSLIIACTVTPYTKRWKPILSIGIPTIALVHNCHWQLSPKLNWRKSSFSTLARRIKWKLLGQLESRLKTTEKFAGLVFPSPAIETYAKQFTSQKTLGIQWAITPTDAIYKKNIRRLNIAIPGGIDFKFRDYDLLFSAINSINRCKKIHLNFLGTPTSQTDHNLLYTLTQKLPNNVTYKTYQSFVETEKYIEHLEESDVILILHKGEVYYAEQQEIGGLSKVSGAENDQARAAKPAIVYSSYQGMQHLKSWQTVYSNKEQLANIIDNFSTLKWPNKFHKHNSISFQKVKWRIFIESVLA